MSEQQQTPRFEIARVRGVHAVAACFQRFTRRIERFRRPAEIARDERNFGFGDDAARTRDGFGWTERARCRAQQSLRAFELPELSHGDATQRQGRCIVAQGNALQRAKWIALRQGVCRRCDQ